MIVEIGYIDILLLFRYLNTIKTFDIYGRRYKNFGVVPFKTHQYRIVFNKQKVRYYIIERKLIVAL